MKHKIQIGIVALLLFALLMTAAFAGNGNGNPGGRTSSGSGITALTGDVTASGTGSVAATVAGINGVTLGSTVATSGNLLIGQGSTWVSKVIAGDVAIGSSGATVVGSIGGDSVTLGGAFTTSGANTTTLTTTGSTNVTLPTTGTLATLSGTETLSNKTFVTPALGTPASGVATNLTGTAASLTAGHVTTNANLTGVVTSSGNATSFGSFTSATLATAISDETGTGASVFAGSPTLTGTVAAAAITATGVVTGQSFISPPSSLTISTATFTPVAVASNTYRVVLVHASCPCTVANPSGSAVDGQKFILEVWQSATGADLVTTWGSNYDFGTAGAPVLSLGASKGDFLGFSYSAQNSKYNYLGIQQGM